MKKINLINKKVGFSGHHQLFEYTIEVPRLKNSETHTIKREVMRSTDSILLLLYSPQVDSFLFCEQFRAGVYCNKDEDNPFILECIAGSIDKETTPEEIAIKEAYEEAGVMLENVQLITTVYKSPGILSEKNYLFYAETPKIPETGFYGVDDEEIKTHLIKREEVYKMMDQSQFMDIATLLALMWFRLEQDEKGQ